MTNTQWSWLPPKLLWLFVCLAVFLIFSSDTNLHVLMFLGVAGLPLSIVVIPGLYGWVHRDYGNFLGIAGSFTPNEPAFLFCGVVLILTAYVQWVVIVPGMLSKQPPPD